jgi:hypothetical protein
MIPVLGLFKVTVLTIKLGLMSNVNASLLVYTKLELLHFTVLSKEKARSGACYIITKRKSFIYLFRCFLRK